MVKILILLILLTGCSNEEVLKQIEISSLTFEYLEEVKLSDIVMNKDISYDDILIDTSKLGKQLIKFSYDDNKEYEFNINVVDTEKPLIFGASNYTILKDGTLDLNKSLGYGDNYDKELELTIEGEYDLNTIGTYSLVAKVTDSSLNESIKNITVNVVEETSYIPYSVDLDDIISKHKTDSTMIGIDVSTWQDEIDFEKVKANGVEFVIIRMGFGHNNDGENVYDNRYFENIKKAKEAGLDIGIYFFSYASNESEAINQANFILDTLDGEDLELPIVFDWEDWEDFEEYNLNFNDINNIADAFLNKIEESGYEAMLYGSASYLENVWDLDYKVWMAHYTDQTDYEGDYYIWQLTSSGKVDGISGNTDLNVLYK